MDFEALRSAGFGLVIYGETPQKFARPALGFQVGDTQSYNGVWYHVDKVFYPDDSMIAYALFVQDS